MPRLHGFLRCGSVLLPALLFAMTRAGSAQEPQLGPPLLKVVFAGDHRFGIAVTGDDADKRDKLLTYSADGQTNNTCVTIASRQFLLGSPPGQPGPEHRDQRGPIPYRDGPFQGWKSTWDYGSLRVLQDVSIRTGQQSGKLEIFVYLSRGAPELERVLTPENIALSCTPAINLFPHRCEPIALDGTLSEWPVVPDARRPVALEVYAVEAVRESRPDGTRRTVQPFYRLGSADEEEDAVSEVQFVASRRPATPPLGGTQTVLELRDATFEPAMPADRREEQYEGWRDAVRRTLTRQ